jgi:hypothetical protein
MRLPRPAASPPRDQSLDSNTMRSVPDIVRQKMGDGLGRSRCSNPSQNLWGITISGEATREAPAQAELRPTCAGAPARPRTALTSTGAPFPDGLTGKVRAGIWRNQLALMG